MPLHNPTAGSPSSFHEIPRGGQSFLFSPTAREAFTGYGEEQDRRQSTVYQKGYRETVELAPNNGATWKWRRIVFETKGRRTFNAFIDTGNGYRRLVQPQAAAELTTLTNLVFEGQSGTDSSTIFTAKVDTSQVKLHSDVMRTLRSGNDFAHFHTFKLYYPFDRNMTYDDDENGGATISTPWAVNGTHGMGDIFIWDIITDVGAPNDTDKCIFRVDGTMYWHEK